MKNSDIKDPMFLSAVEAIDAGDLIVLQELLQKNPELVNRRIDTGEEGYFSKPYLLWFIAGNPIRHPGLAPNIAAITSLLIDYVKQHAHGSLQQQLDYTLGLVATGRVPRESNVQIELMNILIDAGATPGKGHGALAHGNTAATAHLIKRGGTLTLLTAIGLDWEKELMQLLKKSTVADRELALVAASFLGKPRIIQLLLDQGTNVNAYPPEDSGFHSHATALHQAVSSGSVAAVQLLLAAGADTAAKDRIYHGTALDWARHLQAEENEEEKKKAYEVIASHLAGQENL